MRSINGSASFAGESGDQSPRSTGLAQSMREAFQVPAIADYFIIGESKRGLS